MTPVKTGIVRMCSQPEAPSTWVKNQSTSSVVTGPPLPVPAGWSAARTCQPGPGHASPGELSDGSAVPQVVRAGELDGLAEGACDVVGHREAAVTGPQQLTFDAGDLVGEAVGVLGDAEGGQHLAEVGLLPGVVGAHRGERDAAHQPDQPPLPGRQLG